MTKQSHEAMNYGVSNICRRLKGVGIPCFQSFLQVLKRVAELLQKLNTFCQDSVRANRVLA